MQRSLPTRPSERRGTPIGKPRSASEFVKQCELARVGVAIARELHVLGIDTARVAHAAYACKFVGPSVAAL